VLLGTERRPSRNFLLRTITSRGGELSAAAGREFLEIRAVVRAADIDLAIDVLRDMIRESRFDATALESERGVLLQQVAERADNPVERAADALFDALLGGHPLANRPSATAEDVRRVVPDDVRAFWASRLAGENILAGIVCELDHEAVVGRIDDVFGDIPAFVGVGANGNDSPPRVDLGPTDARDLVLDVPGTQAQVVVGVPLPGVTHADRSAIRVANAVLGRLSGRLFGEIRDRRGLAYSTACTVAQYADAGVWFAQVGTAPRNADTVRSLVLGEFARLRDEVLSQEELENAREGEIGARIVAREASRDEAIGLIRDAAYGLPVAVEQDALLRAVTAAEIQRVAREYLDPGRITTIVARPVEASMRVATSLPAMVGAALERVARSGIPNVGTGASR